MIPPGELFAHNVGFLLFPLLVVGIKVFYIP